MTYEQKRTLIAKAIIDTSKFLIKNNIINLSPYHDFISHKNIDIRHILKNLEKENIIRILSVPGYEWEDTGGYKANPELNYELKILDMKKIEKLAMNDDKPSESIVTIRFNTTSGVITKKDNTSKAIGKNTPEHKILVRFAEGEYSVPFKEITNYDDTDMRNEIAKTLRKQTGLNKQELINKKGYLSLHNAVVVKETPTKD